MYVQNGPFVWMHAPTSQPLALLWGVPPSPSHPVPFRPSICSGGKEFGRLYRGKGERNTFARNVNYVAIHAQRGGSAMFAEEETQTLALIYVFTHNHWLVVMSIQKPISGMHAHKAEGKSQIGLEKELERQTERV